MGVTDQQSHQQTYGAVKDAARRAGNRQLLAGGSLLGLGVVGYYYFVSKAPHGVMGADQKDGMLYQTTTGKKPDHAEGEMVGKMLESDAKLHGKK